MAEDSAGGQTVGTTFAEIFVLVLALALVGNIIQNIKDYVGSNFSDRDPLAALSMPTKGSFHIPLRGIVEEKSFLGQVLTGKIDFEDFSDRITPESFLSDRNRIIFNAMSSLNEQGIPITAASLQKELERIGLYEDAGGGAYINELIGFSDTASRVFSIPPKNVDEERAIISAILRGEVRVQDLEGKMDSTDFSIRRNALIFGAAVGVRSAKLPVTPFTVRDKLNEKGFLREAGGDTYLIDRIGDFTPNATFAIPFKSISGEKGLLGAILSGLMDVSDIKNIVLSDNFTDDKNALLYTVILEMHKRNLPINLFSVDERLRIEGLLTKAGERPYLLELVGIQTRIQTRVLDVVKFVLKLVAVIAIAVIFYLQFAFGKIIKRTKLVFNKKDDSSDEIRPKNEKWERVLELSQSTNPSEWKLAIIEADTMLDQMLSRMGYHGDSLGERLMNIEKSDFNTLNDAWEAHKVRNAIAHGGGAAITAREVNRVIELYRKVFSEFSYI